MCCFSLFQSQCPRSENHSKSLREKDAAHGELKFNLESVSFIDLTVWTHTDRCGSSSINQAETPQYNHTRQTTSLLASDSVSYSAFGTHFSENKKKMLPVERKNQFLYDFSCFKDFPVMITGLMYKTEKDRAQEETKWLNDGIRL